MSQPQYSFNFNNTGTVNINSSSTPEESKDITLQARVTPSHAQAIDNFCAGRKITRSDYIRHLATLTPELFDYIELLNKEFKTIQPLLDRLAR